MTVVDSMAALVGGVHYSVGLHVLLCVCGGPQLYLAMLMGGGGVGCTLEWLACWEQGIFTPVWKVSNYSVHLHISMFSFEGH